MKRAIIFSGDLHNVGDLALLLQTAHGLRYYLGLEDIWVRQWGRPDAAVVRQLREHRIRLVSGKNLPEIMKLVPNSLLMFGGGQMVRDNTSLASTGSIAQLAFTARFLGGKTLAIGCGVSSIRKPAHKLLWSFILRQMSLFAVRDEASLKAAKALAPSTTVHLTADLIHLPSPTGELLKDRETDDLILICPCEDLSEERIFDTDLVADLVEAKRTKDGPLKVVILCHDSRPMMDPVVAEKLRQVLSARGIEAVVHESYDLETFIAFYRRARLVVTNRLHAVFFGALAGAEIILFDDGNSKLRAAATQLDIASISAGAGKAAAETAIAAAEGQRMAPARQAALATWATAAARNFTLLQDLVRRKT